MIVVASKPLAILTLSSVRIGCMMALMCCDCMRGTGKSGTSTVSLFATPNNPTWSIRG